ncbi:MAG: M20 family metallopeptidase [Chloroflexi bacterium]|nr:M20 family metallopeptidase [Chloroflexota bacterium]
MPHVADLLAELIAIPSVNPMGRASDDPACSEARLVAWLLAFFADLGVPAERVAVGADRANVIARLGSDPARPTVLWDVHLDTVPADGMPAPFTPRIADGRITGRGACDVKGSLAAMLWALQRVVRDGTPLGVNLVFSASSDEEATATGVRALVECWGRARGVSRLLDAPPDGAIVAEPTDLQVVVAHRGVTRFRVVTTGRACHSSTPELGVNAIYRMARVVTQLEAYAARLGTQIAPHPLCGSATLSVGRIEGGTSVNIVPDQCVIEIDRRLVPGEDPAAARAAICALVADAGVVRCDPPWLEAPGLRDDANGWLAARLLALQQADDPAAPRHAIGVPYGTNAATISRAGVPAVVFGPGSIAQAHTTDEFITIAALERGAEIYRRFLIE